MGTLKKRLENKMILVPTDESKDTLKKLWNKIRDFIRSISDNWDNYDKSIWRSNLIQMMIYL